MIRVVADHKIPFLKGALEEVARVDYLPGNTISREDLLEADALITRTRTRCHMELLEGTKVKFIASATIGHDHIDKEYCRSAGISWTNAPGCNSASVRQYMVSALLYLAVHKGLDLKHTTLGVVGAGNVGSKVAAAARTLGMEVLVNDPPRERTEGPEGFVSLEEVLDRAGVITLHVPLNREGRDKTLHMVEAAFLDKARPGVIIFNTSRGPVVSGKALQKGLQDGRVSHAILDVFEDEPEIAPELLEALTLATPHIAGYSLDGKANGTTMSVQALSRFFGLGLDKWQPAEIPKPERADLLGDAGQEDLYELLWEIYRQTYDIEMEDRRLREQAGKFEELRGDYPFRREPESYRVKLFQPYEEISQIFKQLGFQVLNDYCM